MFRKNVSCRLYASEKASTKQSWKACRRSSQRKRKISHKIKSPYHRLIQEPRHIKRCVRTEARKLKTVDGPLQLVDSGLDRYLTGLVQPPSQDPTHMADPQSYRGTPYWCWVLAWWQFFWVQEPDDVTHYLVLVQSLNGPILDMRCHMTNNITGQMPMVGRVSAMLVARKQWFEKSALSTAKRLFQGKQSRLCMLRHCLCHYSCTTDRVA